ncbi:YicC family protein [Roseomonas sp. JC162]|uniref:YicC family protein n=1 Tax=Neoroseomonas marina TaxID=1232220 RepID=A0A848E857_9PROT|nr:YicC/YloC family endoribonuclease [Neoroseomonas marina]NMJ40352.1 YicC family protein [Neoroseomonas marina]
MAATPLSSMTGFARDGGTLPDGTSFVWEIRSVNGRGLDVRLRLPNGFDALEAPLKEAAAKVLKRGNVSATLTVKREDRAPPRLTPDPAALDQALRLALDLAARIPGCPPPRAEALLTLPGVLRAEAAEPDEAEEEAKRATIAAAFTTAVDGLVASRRAEGAKLADILTVLLDEVAALRDLAGTEAADQPALHMARLRESLAALLEGERRVPEDRLAQEVALLATKSDVREELDRLSAHIAEARRLLKSGEAIGRKLDFLTQEFVREANTLCSKSSSTALTRIGLELKAAIERLKEQSANVE